jgi:hypothetical protein
MYNMYSVADFAPLSQASIKRLLQGHTVRVKHGSGLNLHLSKMQMKKHTASKNKGKGYNLTLDPYQSQMHGEGLFGNIGNAFRSVGNAFVQHVAKPAGREVLKEGKRQGRKLASRVIHQGIPMASEALGKVAGKTIGDLITEFTEDPRGAEQGEVIGQRFGAFGGKKLADYVGQKTGLGVNQIMMTPQMKKAMKPKLQGGRLLIDEPFTTRQAVNTTGRFFKNPKGTIGFGIDRVPPIPTQNRGRMGGTLLIDQPFTTREAVNTTGTFFKNPKGTLGFGMHGKRGGALLQAGYS